MNEVVIPPHSETCEVKGDSKVKKRRKGKAPFLKSWLRHKEHELRHAQQQKEPGAAPLAGGCDGGGGEEEEAEEVLIAAWRERTKESVGQHATG